MKCGIQPTGAVTIAMEALHNSCPRDLPNNYVKSLKVTSKILL